MNYKKRGISHVEVVLSFIIFISFLTFLFLFFNPIKTIKNNPLFLDVVEREIKKNVSTNFSILTLKLDDPPSSNNPPKLCFYFTYDSDLGNVTVKKMIQDNYEEVQAYSKDIGNGRKKIYINDANNNFFYLYFSPSFNENEFAGVNCLKYKKEEYSLGLLRSYVAESYDKLIELNNTYYRNYNELKNLFKIPNSIDFSFSVRDSLGNNIISARKEIKRKTNVFSKDSNIKILYNNGTIKYAILNVQVW